MKGSFSVYRDIKWNQYFLQYFDDGKIVPIVRRGVLLNRNAKKKKWLEIHAPLVSQGGVVVS